MSPGKKLTDSNLMLSLCFVLSTSVGSHALISSSTSDALDPQGAPRKEGELMHGHSLSASDDPSLRLLRSAGPVQSVSPEGADSQALAASVAKQLDNPTVGSRCFVCAAPSVQGSCPSLAAQLDHKLQLEVPADARWYFQGPSYMGEIFYAVVAANDGEVPDDDEMPAGFIGTHLKKVTLKNGAVLLFADGSLDDVTFQASETWTHGFFMQGHNDAYFAEHTNSGREHRTMNPQLFDDAKGRDMCLGRNYRFEPPNGIPTPIADRERSDVPDYLNCTESYPQAKLFGQRMRKSGASVTHVVPWALVTPPGGLKGLPYHSGGARMYFARKRALESNCKAAMTPGPMQPSGYRLPVTSNAAQNSHGDAIEHQCIVACEGLGSNSVSCYPGAILWMVHDLLRGM